MLAENERGKIKKKTIHIRDLFTISTDRQTRTGRALSHVNPPPHAIITAAEISARAVAFQSVVKWSQTTHPPTSKTGQLNDLGSFCRGSRRPSVSSERAQVYHSIRRGLVALLRARMTTRTYKRRTYG